MDGPYIPDRFVVYFSRILVYLFPNPVVGTQFVTQFVVNAFKDAQNDSHQRY
jgi:hypothetical protein